ncbi:MAG TPA: hypothetical protein VHE35_16100 [Kofleriaceae bacterium]|nr:hypothetical protein [Kofleriaceae bacterium]
MTRVLVAWEDARWPVLGALLQRIVKAIAPAGCASYPAVLGDSVEGNGRFAHWVRWTWPHVRPVGVPRSRGFVDHLICVIDGDRAHKLVDAIGMPPKDATAVPAWHRDAETAWVSWLRDHNPADGPPPATVHGIVFRWCKESTLLAGYDQPALATRLDLDPRHREIDAALAGCTPADPRTVADHAFVDTFRQPPLDCINALRKARKLERIAKNAPEVDDAIRDLAQQSITAVRARVPDLVRLAELVWLLQSRAEDTGSP